MDNDPDAGISGSTWDDLDSDGVRDEDEPALAGIPIKLSGFYFPNLDPFYSCRLAGFFDPCNFERRVSLDRMTDVDGRAIPNAVTDAEGNFSFPPFIAAERFDPKGFTFHRAVPVVDYSAPGTHRNFGLSRLNNEGGSNLFGLTDAPIDLVLQFQYEETRAGTSTYVLKDASGAAVTTADGVAVAAPVDSGQLPGESFVFGGITRRCVAPATASLATSAPWTLLDTEFNLCNGNRLGQSAHTPRVAVNRTAPSADL